MTNETGFRPEYLVTSEEELRSLFPPTHEVALKKCQDRLDRHARDFMARSPFLCIGTQSPDGSADVSPRGDPRGFVHVLDDRTLAIPDRPGNNRLDTQSNIIANPSVGLLFMVPGFDETLRINGKARITRDPDLLASMAMKGRAPTIAIVVAIEEVFLHCAKAFRRSGLWDPDQRQNRDEMPSLSKMILDQTTGAPRDADEMNRIDAALEEEYAKSMY
ncbi:MAG: pyridoxamine 5'-phosphate oxidase [Ahrensia sp.]|nr:pyridoxamine 5'-phosphate oxidase [Ahrensia sp.]|tara:strand:- start:10579 stop:11232 length:654 start_codon:yes stop_codon:yes gene_type:complete